MTEIKGRVPPRVQAAACREKEAAMPEFPVVTLTPEPFAYITLTSQMKDIAETMAEGFGRLSMLFAQARAEMAGMPMCHYLDYDESSTTFQLGFPARPADVEALRDAGLSIGETPAGRNMKATHIGPYDTIMTTYTAMTAAMQAQGLEGTKDMWETYFSPPETPPEQIKTEVIWPVA